jgi:hypothetical protein
MAAMMIATAEPKQPAEAAQSHDGGDGFMASYFRRKSSTA